MKYNIGFIGVGSMATAIFESLVKKEKQLVKSIFLYDIDVDKTSKLAEVYNVNISSSISDIASSCDAIVLAVKPDALETVFEELSKVLTHQILFSVAVGITLEKLETLARKDITIVRTMPNIGAMIGRSMTSFCVNKEVSNYESLVIESFLNAFGEAVEIKEDKFDEFTALCGSSPAFYLKIMDAMLNYGLANHFSYDDVVKMVTETMITSAKLLQESNLKAKDLIKRIATKGGTTEAGLNILSHNKIDQVIRDTLIATENESKKTK